MIATIGAVWILFAVPALAAGPDEDAAALARDNTAFAIDLYKALRAQEGNLFLSPYSISSALAMTYAGAAGETEKQMAGVLRFSLPPPRLHPAFAELNGRLASIQESGRVRLSVANSVWPQRDYPFLKEYLELAQRHYGVEIGPVDFKGAPREACEKINAWITEKTQGKIKDVIAPGGVDPLTRLILTNAIYFKGDWAQPFKTGLTRDESFRVGTGPEVKVPLMNQMAKFRHAKMRLFQVLELPYAGNELSMLVLLPDRWDGLAEVEARLTPEVLAECETSMRSVKADVYFPKFEMTCAFSLSQKLRALGMTDAFDPAKANFEGMDGGRGGLFLQEVLHKAFVVVNEQGTEAAAATVARVGITGAPEIIEFRADHPFLFLIREKRHGSILFLGRLARPSGEAWKGPPPPERGRR